MPKKNLFLSILCAFTLVIFIIVFTWLPRIPQWSSYHQFSDARKILGIPNFANVISNIFFILVGLIGFYCLSQQWQNRKLSGKEAIVFLIIFISVILTGFGSAYYHWQPNNASLVWDRLPMTIVLMSLLSLTIMARIDVKLGFWLLIPLICFGIFSVLYWHWTELLGRGDLRLYAIVQFYTILLIMIILFLFPKSYPPTIIYIGMFIFYGLAKLFEHFDLAIYELNGFVSGHTLKHIFSAVSIYGAVLILKKK